MNASVIVTDRHRPAGLAEVPHPPSPCADELHIAAISGVIRVVGLRDRRYTERVTWLGAWLHGAETFEYDFQNTRILSQARTHFDGLLVHGEDRRRMTGIVREWREMLPTKAILAALPGPDIPDCTELLRAGADNVLDVFASPALAAAKTNAVFARLRQVSAPAVLRPEMVRTRVKLSKGEQIILDTVLAGDGSPVPHSVIIARLGKEYDKAAIGTLRVQVHRLNSRLLNACIKNQRSAGLVIEPRQDRLGTGY